MTVRSTSGNMWQKIPIMASGAKMLRDRSGIFLLLLLFSVSAYATTEQKTYPTDQNLYDIYPVAVTYYYGVTYKDALVRMVFHGERRRWSEHMHSIELAKTLNPDNCVRRFFYPIVGVVQIAMNVSLRQGRKQPAIYEFAPYIAFRWANWPWNHYVTTSFAAGEGISYTTSIPFVETMRDADHKRLLNYMMLEATLAPPNNPRLQFLFRLHHRSGAFGLYNAGNTGSNVFGFGLRYLLD